MSCTPRYVLHSVLVHSGGVGGGHYYAFVRPRVGMDPQWAVPEGATVLDPSNMTPALLGTTVGEHAICVLGGFHAWLRSDLPL
jgi:hypothetical protein